MVDHEAESRSQPGCSQAVAGPPRDGPAVNYVRLHIVFRQSANGSSSGPASQRFLRRSSAIQAGKLARVSPRRQPQLVVRLKRKLLPSVVIVPPHWQIQNHRLPLRAVPTCLIVRNRPKV